MKEYELIEVSEVPEGTTHYIPETSDSNFSWIKIVEDGRLFLQCPTNDINTWVDAPYLVYDEEVEILELPKVHLVEVVIKV